MKPRRKYNAVVTQQCLTVFLSCPVRKKEIKLPNHFLGLQEAMQHSKVVTKQQKARIKHHKQLDFI